MALKIQDVGRALDVVELLCYCDKLPMPEKEVRFHPSRKWRFDYGWTAQKVAVEIEGGIWTPGGGRHNRGKGMLGDIEKYNAGTAMGWRIFRTTPQTLHLLRPLLQDALKESQ